MSSLKDRIAFYHTLATLLENGVPTLRALQQHFPGGLSNAAHDMATYITSGCTFTQAAEATGKFEPFELHLMHAGEMCGTLPVTLRSLSEWFEKQSGLRTKLISGCIYPALLYCVAVVILNLVNIFTQGLSLSAAAIRIILLWLAPLAVIFIGRIFISWFSGTALGGDIISAIPLFGNMLYLTETTRFFSSLAACVKSGLPLNHALALSVNSCRNISYQRKFARMTELMMNHSMTMPMAFEQIATYRDRHHAIPALIETGTESGDLDTCLDRIANLCSTELSTLIDRLAVILPLFVYLVVAGFVAFKIISMYAGVINGIDSLMD